jgi:hypothetical protein
MDQQGGTVISDSQWRDVRAIVASGREPDRDYLRR